jgi:two-component system, sensor histidine kinase and response regulator
MRADSDAVRKSSWDAGKVLQNLGGDEKLLREIVDIFVEETPKLVERLQLGVSTGDAHIIETTAHSLKGELSCLGASAADHAPELERMGREHDVKNVAGRFASFRDEIVELVKEVRRQVQGDGAHGG